MQLIPGDLLSAYPHRQFHTLPGLLDSQAALPNSYPNACVPSREAVCTIFMMFFGMTRLGRKRLTGREADRLTTLASDIRCDKLNATCRLRSWFVKVGCDIR